MARMADVASINQTGTGIRLPNFCNLGVMLRSLLVANLFVLVFCDFQNEFIVDLKQQPGV